MNDDLPAAAVRAAAAIEPHVRRTPLELLSDPGDGNQLWAKCENLQVTGSFKVRGAINALLESGEVARSRGVVTASTGNHGAAVAPYRDGSERRRHPSSHTRTIAASPS